jgi:hypothetical protein
MDQREDWEAIQRARSQRVEGRINVIRLAALLIYYGYSLAMAWISNEVSPVPAGSERLITYTALGWILMIVGLQVCVYWGHVPSWLKYVVVGLDTLFVTVVLAAIAGPESPLLMLYLVILATTPLRLSLGLVRFATVGAILAYCALMAYYIYLQLGSELYNRNPGVRIPRGVQVLVVSGLLGTGILAEQSVRQVRRIVEGRQPQAPAA